ncbi:MAG: hypothetical protein N3G76_00275 [Candidatus Micrarchaeota archaeon]|nr:hypothetical protein [Candidatus Micrarchaeota archaeon]
MGDVGLEPEKKPRKSIATRGIPSKESFYLPPHYSPDLRKFQDDNELPLRNYWTLDELINFVFPKKYQPTYHEISIIFMKELVQVHKMEGKEISNFIRANSISKATFYNRVLPRLKRLGLVKVERQTIIAEHSKQKYRPMAISLSKTFGNYLNKIGESWLAIIDDARSRQPTQNKRNEISPGNMP